MYHKFTILMYSIQCFLYIHRVLQPSALSNFRMLLWPQKEGIFQKAKGQPLCLILMHKNYMAIKMKVDFRNVAGTFLIRNSCAKAKTLLIPHTIYKNWLEIYETACQTYNYKTRKGLSGRNTEQWRTFSIVALSHVTATGQWGYQVHEMWWVRMWNSTFHFILFSLIWT